MAILAFVCAATFLDCVFIAQKIPTRIEKELLNKAALPKAILIRRISTLVLCLILLCTSFYTILVSEKNVVADAEPVAYISSNKNGKITRDSVVKMYFDPESNTYFILKLNAINPFKPAYRLELDFEESEKYVEIYNQLVEANPIS